MPVVGCVVVVKDLLTKYFGSGRALNCFVNSNSSADNGGSGGGEELVLDSRDILFDDDGDFLFVVIFCCCSDVVDTLETGLIGIGLALNW